MNPANIPPLRRIPGRRQLATSLLRPHRGRMPHFSETLAAHNIAVKKYRAMTHVD
jgi:hypothetical protein